MSISKSFQSTINICGIPVEINKKDIKNMLLYVKPPNGKVTVSAPLSTSNEAIVRFVSVKVKWIKKQIEKCKNQADSAKNEYISGESIFVWGEKYILQVESGAKKSVVLSGENVVLTVRKGTTANQREKYIREWYRELMKTEITRRLPVWEKKTGLKAESWQVKYMTSRWGSCKSKKRNINLSLLLAMKTPRCLDYIILHELLHFKERGHNERFYGFLDRYMPEWKEIRKELNKQGTS